MSEQHRSTRLYHVLTRVTTERTVVVQAATAAEARAKAKSDDVIDDLIDDTRVKPIVVRKVTLWRVIERD